MKKRTIDGAWIQPVRVVPAYMLCAGDLIDLASDPWVMEAGLDAYPGVEFEFARVLGYWPANSTGAVVVWTDHGSCTWPVDQPVALAVVEIPA